MSVAMSVVTMLVVRVAVVLMVRRVPVIVAMLKYRFDTVSDGNFRHGLRIENLAEEQHEGRSEEREQRDEPDLVQEVHRFPTISASRFHPPARFPYCGKAR
jgi:hypothetical protein